MSKILVIGGAGYIGSHMVRLLVEAGRAVVVFDNFSQGQRQAVRAVEVFQGDLLEPAELRAVFERHDIDAVIHFAALIAVGDSVRDPNAYYRNNVIGTLNLVDAMRAVGVKKLVFSSTAAVFGNPTTDKLAEDHPRAKRTWVGA